MAAGTRNSNRMQQASWLRSTKRLLFGSIMLLLLVACEVDSSAIVLRQWRKADVFPQFVCPGDLVTVDWDMGADSAGCIGCSDEELREMRGVATIVSSPNVFVPPAPSSENRGTELVSISALTTFTFDGRQQDDNWVTESRQADVLAPFDLNFRDVTFAGTCSGGGFGWAGVDTRVLLSANVMVEGICNFNSFAVTVRSATIGAVATLIPGNCTNAFDGHPGLLTAVPLDPLSLTAGADCSPTRSIPPDGFDLQLGLRCTTGSASEAIVAGSPEPTESDLATFVTETPASSAEPLHINFNADSYAIEAGACTTLRWQVENADQVALDGEPVLPVEAEQVCPPATTTYLLTAGNTAEDAQAQVTIEVSEVQTTPAAPSQLSIDARQCNDQAYTVTLAWMDVADNEDGYRVYRGGSLIATLGPNSESYTASPPYGGAQTFGVEAFNDAGASSRPTVQDPGCIF